MGPESEEIVGALALGQRKRGVWAYFVSLMKGRRSRAHRVSMTFAMQMYSQILTVAQQLLLAPLLLYLWGIEIYGVWLLLSAIPIALSVSDFGLTTIAKNEMTMRVARKNQQGAIETYQSVFVMLTGIALIITVAGVVILPFVSLGS